MEEVLDRWEIIINDSHGKHCHDQRKKLSSFFLSVDGMLRREARVVIENLSRVMAAKMDEPILQVRGQINVWIAIAVARL